MGSCTQLDVGCDEVGTDGAEVAGSSGVGRCEDGYSRSDIDSSGDSDLALSISKRNF